MVNLDFNIDRKTKNNYKDNNSVKTESLATHSFAARHIGVEETEINNMLSVLGVSSLDDLIEKTVPPAIKLNRDLKLPSALTEAEALSKLKAIASNNQVYRSFIGMGYHNCLTPPVILRNILENPGWYTAYTPYQAEIAQGRLEALLNYQTMVIELTGLEIANSSLLDEGTAAAEAMSMSYGVCKNKANAFFVDRGCHPQTIEVIKTRANPLGIELIIGDFAEFEFNKPIFGALLQYPATDGTIYDYSEFITKAHQGKAIVTVAADILSLALLTPPGEFGADIAVGSTQRFGVPLGYGGPHAAYFATKEKYKRQVPGRIVGVSKDVNGKPALRLALQTREQHIRREKATSNICTAQVLLAVIASMYAVYHGAAGIKEIATKVHQLTAKLAAGIKELGYAIASDNFFDTIKVSATNAVEIIDLAATEGINLRLIDSGAVGISLDETTTEQDLVDIWRIFAGKHDIKISCGSEWTFASTMQRTSKYLSDPVFNQYHSETELLRYLHKLEVKDLALNTSMIPLGSCTMKLNATAEMIPVTWAEFGNIHPFVPLGQIKGYQQLFTDLENWLGEITGFAGISLQPNAGSQGEYAGLQVIRQYHSKNNEAHRNICLIPESAHGTNPASAVMCGMKVVVVKCDSEGNIDLQDLQAKATKHQDNLAAIMVTYPSTHGVFEAEIKDICAIVHSHGGQVYMDGANMNAQVGLCRPGDFGADVCHLNLHKTFCIPHGGGGPGMGPIGVASHLVPYLPKTSLDSKDDRSIGFISAAPYGSASILVISWMYIAMMGAKGLTDATKIAILNANYMAKRLEPSYSVLFKGGSGFVAHECIIDLRPLKKLAQVEVDDVAKRLIDFGYHAPTVSWPVIGTVMIEPTESESQAELDRFCDAMLTIYEEANAIADGTIDAENNPLKNAPHTAESLLCGDWDKPYTREQAAYPAPWTKEHKFWPVVSRIDNAYGDRNLVCSCEGMEAYK
ncbi:glycine decarboxylase, PLP-dependent, subunit (protein P) of glycine cleavage complex [Hyella patelloides LEGE 07179]|uniref:Glycine dehydrogenase (decarboxylating) n=1 Tax=Hyella patelloides LEGE 07179 TaxID=945734 RepID=A0A563VKS1_9CYAN|nr:aminomethyl-transferring glycine dehydrogenase [Hyella patelloides]VEP12056.1 glycine decarboxylase, PLP-dependent, subunit (protein P) of glycine cleavage complex [Hyella patelloides LEGE 07179]